MATTKVRENNMKTSQKLSKPLTREERRAKLIKKITSSKEEATKFLVRAGILGEDGKLAEIYRRKSLSILVDPIW